MIVDARSDAEKAGGQLQSRSSTTRSTGSGFPVVAWSHRL